MISTRRLVAAVFCLAVIPATSAAQDRAEDEDFMNDLFEAVMGPNWNVGMHFSASNYGRFVLQRADMPGGGEGERQLTATTDFSFGGSAGIDILPRTGARLSYTYGTSDLEYKTDVGNGSAMLDVDEVGGIKSHTVALEVIRYMLPSAAKVTPYVSAGLLGNWWVLRQETSLAVPSGGDTQFRGGALGSFGLQVRATRNIDVRGEVSTHTARNPFTGRESFRAMGGTTIEEPSRVGRTDFRLAIAYSFGKPVVDLSPVRDDDR
jgi:hypothetical protein